MNDFVNKFFARLVADERGLTAVEYAVLGALVVAAIVTATGSFDESLTAAFAKIFTKAPA